MSELENVLKRAEKSGQSEAKAMAEFIRDLGDNPDPALLFAVLEEFQCWAEEFKNGLRADLGLPQT